MAALFRNGPHLKSGEIVDMRAERLARVNQRLLARDIIPALLVLTAQHSEDGIGSYLKSLNNLGARVHAEVTVGNVPDERVARRRINEHNPIPGATMLMVPVPQRELEPSLLAANQREIEGITPGSRFEPSTPLNMVHMAEFGIGHRLVEMDDPDRDIVVAGFGRSVGRPLVGLLRRSGIKALVVTNTNDPAQCRMMQGRRVTFSGMGEPGALGAEQFGEPLGKESQRFAIDVGVRRVDGRLCGDIDQASVADLTDLMYTPPSNTSGPMNAITMLERTTFLAAEAAGALDEFDVAIYSLMGMRNNRVVAAA